MPGNGTELSTAPTVMPAFSAEAERDGDCLSLVRIGSGHELLETDYRCLHPRCKNFKAVPPGMKQLPCLAKGINGNVFVYVYQGRKKVAVKKLRRESLVELPNTETDERKMHLHLSDEEAPPMEDALTELGVMQYLNEQSDMPPYILKLLGIFSAQNHVWLVTELAEGMELYSQVKASGKFPANKVRHYTQQSMEGVAYLHSHKIAHRDISLENLLLQGDTVKVMDFGQAVPTVDSRTGEVLRYFRRAGKDFYRAPECNVPRAAAVDIVCPKDTFPGEVVVAESAPERASNFYCVVRIPEGASPGVVCRAEVFGYLPAAAHPVGCRLGQ